jgi:hypothetical protein
MPRFIQKQEKKTISELTTWFFAKYKDKPCLKQKNTMISYLKKKWKINILLWFFKKDC